MKRLGQISVLVLAALAVWLVLPGADEPAPRGGEASRPEGERPALESAALEARSAAAPVVPLVSDAAAPADSPRAASEGNPSRAANPAVTAALADADVRLVEPNASLAFEDMREPEVRYTAERSAYPDYERRRHVARIHRRDLPAPDPIRVEQQVEREVPEGSVAPEYLEEARADARARITEEQLIVDQLARQSLGENASEHEVRARRGIGMTLLAGEDPETRERIMQRAADQINAQR